MESSDQRLGQRTAVEQSFHALAHLARGFVRKRNRQNRIGRNTFLLNQPCNSASDHASLTRTGSSQNEEWAIRGFDRGALFGVQV